LPANRLRRLRRDARFRQLRTCAQLPPCRRSPAAASVPPRPANLPRGPPVVV